MLAMRRDQQARRMQRRGRPGSDDGDGPAFPDPRSRFAVAGMQFRGGPGGPGHPRGMHPHDRSLGGAARFRMLDALAGGPRTVSELAEATGVDQPRASRLVADAADRGLVRRGVDPADARRALIELTDAGRAFLTEAHSTRRSAVETALAEFTPDETARFAELLDRFVAAWPRD